MTIYPAQIDTTTSLPEVIENSTPINGDVFNRLRDAIVAVEVELGIKPSSIYSTVRSRLDSMEGKINGFDFVKLGGDLGGDSNAASVIGIQGNPISNSEPQFGEVLTWNGITWSPAPPQALSGDIGPQGPQGLIGEQGPAGPIGFTGNQGDTGIAGPIGPAGATGANGATGSAGSNGSNGVNGISSYSILTSSFVQPSSSITIQVSSTLWMAVGETIFIENGGYYYIISISNTTHVIILNLGYSANTAIGVTISLNSLISPSGPIGATGLTGSVGLRGPSGNIYLIYRPGGNAIDNVFTSWTNLMIARNVIDGPITFVIDDSIISPALVDVGIWELNKNTSIIGYKGIVNYGNLPVLKLPNGAHFRNPSYFKDINITGNSTSTPSIDGYAPFTSFDFEAYDSIFLTSPTATQSLFDTTFNSSSIINLYGNSNFLNNSNGAPIISNSEDIALTINLYDETSIDGYTLNIDGYLSVANINISSTASDFSTTQSSSATLSVRGGNLASGFQSASIGSIPIKNGVGTTSWTPFLFSYRIVAKGQITLINGQGTIFSGYVADGSEQILLTVNTLLGTPGRPVAATPTAFQSDFLIISRKNDLSTETSDQSILNWILVA